MKGRILFEEEQTFVGTWTWYLLFGILVLSIVPSIYLLFVSENILDGLISLGVILGVMSLVILLHWAIRLRVTVDRSSIYYTFSPFIKSERILTKMDIQEMKVRKYRPIMEYGGWGYRSRFRSGKALTVSGNFGLQLTLADSKQVLIGTQKPKELEVAIRQLEENWATAEDYG